MKWQLLNLSFWRDLPRRAKVMLAVAFAPFAVIGITGCDGNTKAADGYVFEQADWVALDLNIRVVPLPSVEALRAAYTEVNGRTLHADEEMFAFGVVAPSGRCTIYKVDSRVLYAPEADGHEFNHCMHGEWHPRQTAARAHGF